MGRTNKGGQTSTNKGMAANTLHHFDDQRCEGHKSIVADTRRFLAKGVL
jgi:hypothetical protein